MPSQKTQERMIPEDQLQWQAKRRLTFAGKDYQPYQIIDPEDAAKYRKALGSLERTGKASRILPQVVVAPDYAPADTIVPGRGVKAHREAARLNREAGNRAEREEAHTTALEEASVRLANAHRANRARKRPRASEPDPLPPAEEVDDPADDDDDETDTQTDPVVVVTGQMNQEGQTDGTSEERGQEQADQPPVVAPDGGSPGAGDGGAGQAGGGPPPPG